MNKKPVKLTRAELEDVVFFQKKSIEGFAECSHKYDKDKSFEIFAVGIAFIISNIMGSFGVKNINDFLDDMVINIKKFHNDIQKNACYMQYSKGKKISEGKFN